jgi:mannose-1-phosphate guanylyltransferase/phosphomannomutase
MKTLILAGGRGTRVNNQYSNIKPLITILGKPILDILLNQLKDFEIFININKEDSEKLKGYSDKVNFIIEDRRMGKAQPIREFAEKYNEDFIVIHCDVYSDIDIKRFIEKSKDNKEIMTMVVKNISKGKAFGVTVFDEHKKVYGFTRERYVNTGIYLVRPGVKEYIKKDIYQDLDKDTFPKLIKDKKLKVYIHNGFWFDCGTIRVISKFSQEKDNAKRNI